MNEMRKFYEEQLAYLNAGDAEASSRSTITRAPV
jgi:hypothetical protein